MDIFREAADTAAASSAKVAATAVPVVYSFTQLPLSSYAAALSIVLSLVYLWGALPRFARTAVALKRGLVNRDWTLWRKLGDKPMKED
jgi:hypothetical protein